MRYVLLACLASITMTACAPVVVEPICNREAQEWDKFGTQEDDCQKPKTVMPPAVGGPDGDTGPDPRGPSGPRDPDPVNPSPDEPRGDPERVKGNNGLGDGDQRSPGGSRDHNRAENERGNPGHKSGKAQNSN